MKNAGAVIALLAAIGIVALAASGRIKNVVSAVRGK